MSYVIDKVHSSTKFWTILFQYYWSWQYNYPIRYTQHAYTGAKKKKRLHLYRKLEESIQKITRKVTITVGNAFSYGIVWYKFGKLVKVCQILKKKTSFQAKLKEVDCVWSSSETDPYEILGYWIFDFKSFPDSRQRDSWWWFLAQNQMLLRYFAFSRDSFGLGLGLDEGLSEVVEFHWEVWWLSSARGANFCWLLLGLACCCLSSCQVSGRNLISCFWCLWSTCCLFGLFYSSCSLFCYWCSKWCCRCRSWIFSWGCCCWRFLRCVVDQTYVRESRLKILQNKPRSGKITHSVNSLNWKKHFILKGGGGLKPFSFQNQNLRRNPGIYHSRAASQVCNKNMKQKKSGRF